VQFFRSRSRRFLLTGALALVALYAALSFLPVHIRSTALAAAPRAGCPNDDSGLKLPAGFCATIFADGIGHARHMVVAGGVLYVNTWSGEYYGNDTPHAGGFLVALQDKAGAGKADVQERFGETVQSGGHGGTGIGLYNGSLYVESNDRIVRYTLPAGSIVPQGAPATIVSGLPLTGDHPMHPFISDAQGALYVDVASATNSCQVKNRTLQSPGVQPCTELLTRGGIWRYDANKSEQHFSSAERFATGIRNGEGFAVDASGRMYVTQHGRDQLHSNWPQLFQAEQEATLPAEAVMQPLLPIRQHAVDDHDRKQKQQQHAVHGLVVEVLIAEGDALADARRRQDEFAGDDADHRIGDREFHAGHQIGRRRRQPHQHEAAQRAEPHHRRGARDHRRHAIEAHRRIHDHGDHAEHGAHDDQRGAADPEGHRGHQEAGQIGVEHPRVRRRQSVIDQTSQCRRQRQHGGGGNQQRRLGRVTGNRGITIADHDLSIVAGRR